MKTLKLTLALFVFVVAGLAASAQPAEPSPDAGPPPAGAPVELGSPPPSPDLQGGPPPDAAVVEPGPEIAAAPGAESQTPEASPQPGAETRPEAPTRTPAASERPSTARSVSAPAAGPATPGLSGDGTELRLNFRGAPLDLVLNYLSEAAGFIIDLQTEVKGKVDVWSNQPLTKDEAVDVLNTVLNRNGYAAIRNGRTLTIVSRDEAKKRDIPVRSGNEPTAIPRNEEIVTQIIPVRFINATQLVRDLQPLLAEKATLTANEGGNALVLTDSQTNIRRMAEIVRALDTAISSTSAIRVFPLKYADAKTLATVVRDLFQTQDTGTQRSGAAAMQQFFRGMRGGPPGVAGGDASAASGSSGNARVSTPRVTAVADERSNALVVSAPDTQMPLIEELVSQVDVNVEDVTELRVFRLRFADPQETADLLTELFPDPTTSSSSQSARGGQFRFGGGPFGGPGGMTASSTTSTSERSMKQSRVLAVPDLRTGSVVVSASRDMMPQIAAMLQTLDADPARKQTVHIYSVENTDPQMVQQILQELFPNQNYGTSSASRNNSSTRQVGNQLQNRATSSSQNQSQRSGMNSAFGSSGNSSFGQTGR